MSKIKYLIFILLLSMMIIPVTAFANENIGIKSIVLDSKSDNTVIKSEPTFKGLEMNFDLSFKTTGDFVKYKVVVKNDSDTDFKISEDTSFIESEYMTYKYEVEDELKAKEETTIYVTITYSKEVDSSKLVNNKYIESNKAVVQLLDGDGQIINEQDIPNNPNTGDNSIIIIVLLLCVSIMILFVFNRKKPIRYLSMVLAIGLCVIPAFVYALETIKLTINVNVEIPESYPVYYIIQDTIKISEKNNYKVFDFSEFGSETPSCITIEEKDEYELCYIIYKMEIHTPGEVVNIPTEITYHSFNGDGNLIENIIPMNGVRQNGMWYYNYNGSIRQFDEMSQWWIYLKALNNYDDIDELSFTGNIDNQWMSTNFPMIELYSPNSFTMQNHSIFIGPAIETIGGDG